MSGVVVFPMKSSINHLFFCFCLLVWLNQDRVIWGSFLFLFDLMWKFYEEV